MQRRGIDASGAPQPARGAYVQALELTDAKRIVFVSGQIPAAPDGTVPDGFEAQARLCWRNVIAQLRAADMSIDDLVKVTFFLSDRKHISEYRRTREEALAGRKIAFTTIIAGIFDERWLLEIEGIAAA